MSARNLHDICASPVSTSRHLHETYTTSPQVLRRLHGIYTEPTRHLHNPRSVSTTSSRDFRNIFTKPTRHLHGTPVVKEPSGVFSSCALVRATRRRRLYAEQGVPVADLCKDALPCASSGTILVDSRVQLPELVASSEQVARLVRPEHMGFVVGDWRVARRLASPAEIALSQPLQLVSRKEHAFLPLS